VTAWSTTWTVARREALDISRDGRFRWAAAMLLTMLIASAVAGIHRAAELRLIRETAQREERARWLDKGKMLPHPAMHFGLYVYQPYLDLAGLDDGIEPYVGAYSLLEAHEQKVFQDRPVADEVPTRRLTDLTPALCLQYLAPLLVIAIGFSAFVGERENGTWRQVLSTGASVRHVAYGKVAGVVLPLVVVLVPAAIIGSAAILATSPQTSEHLALRLSLMSVAYVLFFAVYVGAVLVVSALATTPRQSLLVLFTMWFVTSLMAPFLAIDIGRSWHPSPTSFQFAADILKAQQTEHYPTAAEIQAELLADYHVKRVADLPVDPTGIHLLRQMVIDDRIYNAALARLHESYRRQASILRAAAGLSPLLAMQQISMGLSGTDLESHLDFAQYASRYRHEMETILDNDAAYNLTPGPRDRELWDKIPPFRYPGRPFAAVLQSLEAPAASLGLVVLLVATAFARSLQRVET
jgi:ABC-2 type transport system permease protein